MSNLGVYSFYIYDILHKLSETVCNIVYDVGMLIKVGARIDFKPNVSRLARWLKNILARSKLTFTGAINSMALRIPLPQSERLCLGYR